VTAYDEYAVRAFEVNALDYLLKPVHPDSLFLRIHRSVIINLDSVLKVEEWFNGTFRVYITGEPEPFIMSRRMARDIRSRLG